jgi:PilZ domain
VSAQWEYIGDTPCDECRGTGKNPEGESCPRCWGSGFLPVFREPTVSKPAVQSSERRHFPRYYTDLPLRLRNQQEEELAGRCIVISEAGVAAILPKPISTGSVVTLELPIPALHPAVLETLILVRNQVILRHGCEFVSLKDSEREAIRQFCGGLVAQSG